MDKTLYFDSYGNDITEEVKEAIRDCNTCANATNDFNNDIDNGCYMCCKGLENNYRSVNE